MFFVSKKTRVLLAAPSMGAKGSKPERQSLSANTMADEYGSDGLDDGTPAQGGDDLPGWMVSEATAHGDSVDASLSPMHPSASSPSGRAPQRRTSWKETLHPVTTGGGGGVAATTHRLVDPFVVGARVVNGLTALAAGAIAVTQVMLVYRAVRLSRGAATAARFPLPLRDLVLRGYGVGLALFALLVELSSLGFSYGAGRSGRGSGRGGKGGGGGGSGRGLVAGSLAARSWALRGLLHVLVGTLALTKGPGWQYAGGGGAGVMSPYLDAGMLYEMPAFAIIVAGALYLLANACCLNVLYARRVTRARIRRAHEQGMLEKLYVEREDDDALDVTL